jgi:thiol-disulfide isomerase/thioredoxin
MKLNKSQRSNLLLLAVIALLIFSPIGGKVKEFTARLMSTAPSIINIDNRVVMTNYNWKLKGLNAEDYNFEEARGKVVFVNYWATWCPPCRAEMPDIQALYVDYKDKVEFVFITNEKAITVTEFLDKYDYTLPSYNQLNNGPSQFKVSSIPTTYLLNKRGEIVVYKVGPADWDGKKVRTLLDSLLLE